MSLKDTLEPDELGVRGKIHIFVGLVTFIFVTCMADWTAGSVAAMIAMFITEALFELLTAALNYFQRR